jgi:selenocysteine lyase/cysteine desulfurase
MTAGITSFRLHGRTSKADTDAIVAALRERFGVFTVMRPGPDAGEVVRVTPSILTRMTDVERLLEGLSGLAREG